MGMNENFLLDSWEESKYDDSIEGFRKMIERMDEGTKYIKTQLNRVDVLHVMNNQDEENPGSLRFFRFGPPTEEGCANVHVGGFTQKSLLEKGAEELVTEAKRSNNTIFRLMGKTYFTDYYAFRTLAQILERGKEFLEPRFSRDYAMSIDMHGNTYGTKEVTFVVRKAGDLSKVYAVHSGQYVPVKQAALLEICDKLSEYFGKVKMNWWQINHQFSTAILTFPEKAEEITDFYKLPDKFVPGVRICISDTGRSSLTIEGNWQVAQNSYNRTKKVSKKHAGKNDEKTLVQDLLIEAEQQIFSEFAALPKQLSILLNINVSDPAAAIEEIVKKIGMGHEKQLGIKITKKIKEQLIASLNPNLYYTAYDITMMFLSLPSCIYGLKESALEKLERLVSKVPWLDVYAATDTDNDDDILIVS